MDAITYSESTILLQKCFKTISKLLLRPAASEEKQNTQYFPQKTLP